jgi:hypothetical protein
VTAPLRRLADRYANEIVLALPGVPPAGDAALDELVETMQVANHRDAGEAAVVDAVECTVLRCR